MHRLGQYNGSNLYRIQYQCVGGCHDPGGQCHCLPGCHRRYFLDRLRQHRGSLRPRLFEPDGGRHEPIGDGADERDDLLLPRARGRGGKLHERPLDDGERDNGGGDALRRAGQQRHAGGGGERGGGNHGAYSAPVPIDRDQCRRDADGRGLHLGGELCRRRPLELQGVVFREQHAGNRQRHAAGHDLDRPRGGRPFAVLAEPGNYHKRHRLHFHHGGHRGESGL